MALDSDSDKSSSSQSRLDQGEGGLSAIHPAEVMLPLDITKTLVWNPTTWHATERQPPPQPQQQQQRQQRQQQRQRRAFGWNYGRRGSSTLGVLLSSSSRDAEAVAYIFEDEWRGWPEARKLLWGLPLPLQQVQLDEKEKEKEANTAAPASAPAAAAISGSGSSSSSSKPRL